MLEVARLVYIGLYVMNFPSVCELLGNGLSEVGIFLLHMTHKFVQLKMSEGQPKYVH